MLAAISLNMCQRGISSPGACWVVVNCLPSHRQCSTAQLLDIDRPSVRCKRRMKSAASACWFAIRTPDVQQDPLAARVSNAHIPESQRICADSKHQV